jgi:hypothetical protein
MHNKISSVERDRVARLLWCSKDRSGFSRRGNLLEKEAHPLVVSSSLFPKTDCCFFILFILGRFDHYRHEKFKTRKAPAAGGCETSLG